MFKLNKKMRKSDVCLNCGRELEDFNFCPDCGQINSHKQVSLSQIIRELLGEFFTFDSKFFKSFAPLVKKPGHLTTEYILGRRATYILPMRLFVFTTVLYFFMLALNSSDTSSDEFKSTRVSSASDSLAFLMERYEGQLSEETKTLIIGEITDNYQLYTKEKKRSLKEEKLLKEIAGYNLNSSENSHRFFVFKLLKHYRIKSKPGIKYGNDELDLESLEKFIKVEAPKGVNKNNRFYNYLAGNYKIREREIDNDESDISFSQDTTVNPYLRTFLQSVENMSNSGGYGQTIFMKDFMGQMSKLVFLMVPIFALLLKIFYIRSKIFYINHLIFSLHIHSVLLILLLFPLIMGIVGISSHVTGITYFLIIIVFTIYTTKALKRVYRQKGVKTIIKFLTIIFIYLFLYMIGTAILAVSIIYNNF